MAERGVKLSYTAYIVKAAAEAMAVAPAINGRWEKDRIAISPTIDIGVGTALGEKGLVVPVVKDAGKLSLEQIGAKLDELTCRARDGKLERSDVSGGSFTISNHGVSGSLLAAPIILHQGQAAILGIGKLEKRVIVREVNGQDAILVRPMAYVTLTIDHRVVDGHQTNAWLSRFVEVLESWPDARPTSPRFRGEGNHAKHGGGVLPAKARKRPLHRLRRFPSPANAGEDDQIFD
jgi:2-oxoglutarate dehydrogenase E2 component (dihydrolipoamide succinyltransferase)